MQTSPTSSKTAAANQTGLVCLSVAQSEGSSPHWLQTNTTTSVETSAPASGRFHRVTNPRAVSNSELKKPSVACPVLFDSTRKARARLVEQRKLADCLKHRRLR